VWVTVVALQILLNDTYKLNHCKEMGAKLGRRFLKQPAEKLKAVFVTFKHRCRKCSKRSFQGHGHLPKHWQATEKISSSQFDSYLRNLEDLQNLFIP